MNLIFNLTIRTPLKNIYEEEELSDETCANCNGCTGVKIKNVSWTSSGIKMQIWEADHKCATFNTTIDVYHAESPDIQCSKFKALEYKKL